MWCHRRNINELASNCYSCSSEWFVILTFLDSADEVIQGCPFALVRVVLPHDTSLFQSVRDHCFDNLSAIYFLLLDRSKRHNSHKSDPGGSIPTQPPMRTERRSSITTGKGQISFVFICWLSEIFWQSYFHYSMQAVCLTVEDNYSWLQSLTDRFVSK